jgi:hypothetical protein
MAYALAIRTEERPAPAEGLAWSDLWMLPILLLALIFDKFRRHLARLKDMRRTRPMPKDWRSFYPDLRRSEWAIHWFCFEGARQIILGQDLDLSALSLDPEPPEDFQPSMPRTAIAMHLRLQDIARFHADPERWIRRHAERIRATEASGSAAPAPLLRVAASSPRRLDVFYFSAAVFSVSAGLPIRGPPPGSSRLPIATAPRLARHRPARSRTHAHSHDRLVFILAQLPDHAFRAARLPR